MESQKELFTELNQNMENNHKVVVIVGKFQVHYLNEAHKVVLMEAFNRASEGVIILLTPDEGIFDKHNPLPFNERARMIKNFYHFKNLYGKDLQILEYDLSFAEQGGGTDVVLQKTINFILNKQISLDEILILGGENNDFLQDYGGVIQIKKIDHIDGVAAWEQRENIQPPIDENDSTWFRAGMVYAHKLNNK